ncbi:MAG: aminoacyl-tRNA hydrolase [Kiritimatiellaeota bacterium]|nr:aminoacyl-tRNA hydrolase [Kiritimatiellota bacterium]
MSKIPHTRTHLVVGLGNPGEEYAKTRHNAGFMAIDKLRVEIRGTFKETRTPLATYYEGRCKGEKLLLLKPMTFMNASGEAVVRVSGKFGIAPNEILLVYDDIDIPLGSIRIREGGGSAGHNGVESVIRLLGSAEFTRLRIGIGREENGNQKDFVLSEFSENDEEVFERTLDTAVEAAKLILYRGTNKAMNRYNSRR